MTKRRLIVRPWVLCVCRLDPSDPVPTWATGEFVSVTRTGAELSIVCAQASAPEGVVRTGPWRTIEIEGPLEHTAVGVIAPIAAVLADARIPVFIVSSFHTDFVLVPADRLSHVCAALADAGYEVPVHD